MIEEPVQVEAPSEDLDPIPPLIAEDQQTFCHELPRLLPEHPRRWVAYRGQTRLGLGSSKNELFDRLLRAGYKRGKLLVRRIDPANLPAGQAVDASPDLSSWSRTGSDLRNREIH
jgi:hypothetical protein